jgi:hypothetical protein
VDFVVREHVLDFARILYDPKDSYMVLLKLPAQKKRFVCHNLKKVSPAAPRKYAYGRAR